MQKIMFALILLLTPFLPSFVSCNETKYQIKDSAGNSDTCKCPSLYSKINKEVYLVSYNFGDRANEWMDLVEDNEEPVPVSSDDTSFVTQYHKETGKPKYTHRIKKFYVVKELK